MKMMKNVLLILCTVLFAPFLVMGTGASPPTVQIPDGYNYVDESETGAALYIALYAVIRPMDGNADRLDKYDKEQIQTANDALYHMKGGSPHFLRRDLVQSAYLDWNYESAENRWQTERAKEVMGVMPRTRRL